ncbi:MAG: hypothetical protein IPG48_06760 [Saprospiraceae bacterium]|nr:hypothetical protein [Saprospiraceae bacterium]MBK6665854.1 hypothetical protein [Saprospiraceae bacterium]MBK7700498.1 hypothetical protein [Saprospiraceae bacterium]MBK8827973.1 hypothetical protein [Saprospiraceae bacterium]MBK8886057.1 hypothetical protein [Saprospiraceae bacterium]
MKLIVYILEVSFATVEIRSYFENDEICIEKFGYDSTQSILARFADIKSSKTLVDIEFFTILDAHNNIIKIFINKDHNLICECIPKDNLANISLSKIKRLKIIQIS